LNDPDRAGTHRTFRLRTIRAFWKSIWAISFTNRGVSHCPRHEHLVVSQHLPSIDNVEDIHPELGARAAEPQHLCNLQVGFIDPVAPYLSGRTFGSFLAYIAAHKHMADLGMNERAWNLADRCVERAAELRVGVHKLANGARVLDFGANVPGGFAAGRALAELCMGGLGNIEFTSLTIDGESWPGVQVWTDHPAETCMGSQYAGWAVTPEGFFAMGSGPLRAKARVEQELFEKLDYVEDARRGVLVLEGRALPTDDVARWVGRKAGLEPDRLTFAVAPTASLAGGIQIVARVVETGLHKMDTIGFDVRRVVSAMGTAPLASTAKSDIRAIGRTNDCILYGGQARYTVRAEDAELAELAERLPASASADYGTPFYDIFKRYDSDFYKIDPMLFSPAEVWLTSATSGRTFHGGRLNADVLRASLYGD
jgi:methenyltetrahydromethanopterin cyclohydrolase